MTYDGCKSKFDVHAYIAYVGRVVAEATGRQPGGSASTSGQQQQQQQEGASNQRKRQKT
jgi:hypothetical protein